MRHGAASNPYVFVVGCPRSGTTLLQRMLDAHPQLALTNDTDFIRRAVDLVVPAWRDETATLLRAAIERDSERLVASSRRYHRFPRLDLEPEAVDRAAAGATDFAGFVSLLYDEVAKKTGKPFAGDKTPEYVRYLPLLHTLFPRARFVHLLRDGRDVALALREWKPSKGPNRVPLWSEDPFAVCALWWRSRVESGIRDGQLLPRGTYLAVRYEELVTDPALTLAVIVDFLGLQFAPQMLDFNRDKMRLERGLSANRSWLGPTPGLRDWRKQMAPGDVELFEALAGDTLEAAGYERHGAGPSPAVRIRAGRANEQWASYWADHERRQLARGERRARIRSDT
jgi:hypothetical protein